MTKQAQIEKNRAITAQVNADAAVMASAAPEVKAILGYVPRDGVVSIIAGRFISETVRFQNTRDLVRNLLESGVDDAALDRAETAFMTARETLLTEIRRYQAAAGVVFKAALWSGNDKLADRALVAIQDYSCFAEHVSATKVGV